jgi:DNA repair protein RadC
MRTSLARRLGYSACSDVVVPVLRGPSIRGSRQVHDLVRAETAGLAQEVFLVLLLDAKHRLIRRVVSAVGTLASVDVHPRETFREAVRHAAAAVIVVHNHPSGDPEPSTEDVALTKRLKDAGTLLGIPLLDHLVVCDNGFVSLADRGLL